MGDTGCVIGRYTQLGRQLRKLRHLSGDAQPRESATTLRRATKLACDLACAQAELDDAGEALAALGAQGLLDPELAARLTAWAGTHAAEFGAPAEDGSAASADAIQAARDLDRFLRSLEQGAPAPELPFAPISSVAASTERPDSTAAVVVSGRVIELEERGGAAVITVDGQPIPMTLDGVRVSSFVLRAAPTSRSEVHHAPTGEIRIAWSLEHVELSLAADFGSVQLGARQS